MTRLAQQAAANNASWCDLVCRLHGIEGQLLDEAWTSPVRTPPLFPDAVTLQPDAPVGDLLEQIDTRAGCSVKDSFASLDLTGEGFRVLFEAEWIVRHGTARPSVGPAVDGWEVVDDPQRFAAWERAWRGDGPDGDTAAGVLAADLLTDPAVDVVSRRDGDDVVAGAVLHRTNGVVGISNLFTVGVAADAAWQGCVALVEAQHPGVTVVGYESGERLQAALATGFDGAGSLMVWMRDE